MGDPKFARRKYETPNHPWQAARIKEEKEIVKKYGLKSKTEVWKARSMLRSIRGQARDLQGKQRRDDPQVARETQGLLARLQRLGIIGDDAGLDDVLALNVEAVLMRRLQTMTYLKGLAATPSQARQLIVHGHVSIGGRRVTIPGYAVLKSDEPAIEYAPSSPLQNMDHPVRPKVIEEQELAELPPIETQRRGGAGRGRGPNPQQPRTGGFGRGGPGGFRGGPRGPGGPGGPGGPRGPPRAGGGAPGGAPAKPAAAATTTPAKATGEKKEGGASE